MVRFALLTGLLSLALSAQADALANFLARLQQLQSLEAYFTQVTRDNNGRTLQHFNGAFTVAKTKKLRCQPMKRYEQTVLGDGEMVSIYDTNLKEVSCHKLD